MGNALDIVTLLGLPPLQQIGSDLCQTFVGMNTLRSRYVSYFGLGLAGFAWLNVTLFRALFHWKGMPYDLHSMLLSSYAQTYLSILWVTTGMLLVMFAARLASRGV